ncbi:MAG: hypothetical protein RRY07_09205 [Bacteroidaceae bacterium]
MDEKPQSAFQKKGMRFVGLVVRQFFCFSSLRGLCPKQSSGVINLTFLALMDTAPTRGIVLCSGLLRLRSQ